MAKRTEKEAVNITECVDRTIESICEEIQKTTIRNKNYAGTIKALSELITARTRRDYLL